MSSPRSGCSTGPSPRPGAPCSENDVVDQSMSPAQSNVWSPIPSNAADCPTSDGGGTGEYCSRAPTPNCLASDDIILPENDAISQEATYHYMDLLQRLMAEAQGRAATPCSGLDADPNTNPEMAVVGDSAQSQSSKVFDWLQASTMALDELPDSDQWYQPGYQLDQEWLKYMNEEKKRVAAERGFDKSFEICADMETG